MIPSDDSGGVKRQRGEMDTFGSERYFNSSYSVGYYIK